MVTHLEPDILECEVKWAVGSTAANKAHGGDRISAKLFKNTKRCVVKVLSSICQQIWKTQQWPQDWKRSIFIPIPKKSILKNVQTTTQLCSLPMLGRFCSTTLIAESEEELKSPLMKVKEDSEKPGLKLNFQKMKIWYLVPTFLGEDWGKNGNSERFYFLDSKVTADDCCSHGMKRCLLLGRKTMTTLDSILKSRDITLPSHDFSSSHVWL